MIRLKQTFVFQEVFSLTLYIENYRIVPLFLSIPMVIHHLDK